MILLNMQTTPTAQATRPVKVEFQRVQYSLKHGESIKTYTLKMYRFYGATDGQWKCLVTLWTRESHWNYKARNPHGGAYGIPQAYPAKKLALYGKDWKTNPAVQVLWGLRYIKQRYNNDACLALKHHNRRGFY